MHDELVDYVNAPRYCRTSYRRGYRNGGYKRRLVTTWGTEPKPAPRPPHVHVRGPRYFTDDGRTH